MEKHKGESVKIYGDLTLMELFMHYKNVYEQSNVGQVMCYGSLSHICSLFEIDDVQPLERNAIYNFEVRNAQLDRKETTCMDKCYAMQF